MPFISLPNGVKVAMEFTLNGQLVVNVYYVTTTNPIITANLSIIAQVFRDWWINNLRGSFSSGIALVRVVATDASVANGQQSVVTLATPSPGGVASVPASNQVALVITDLTGYIGRSFRGRHYHAGVVAADVTDNNVDQARLTAILTAYSTLTTSLNAFQTTRVVASFQANGVPRAVGVATPVLQVRGNTRVDTQRRRLPGTGA